ncbi:hypothetical protein EVG20_g11027 [Dentipellis fragilis]|uniref:Uncharacterized protein n=1 Tax=Dentipellis fragilis TaxID=205917 RepID=A0A4Y9XMR0_9AGAM|nr:hypothetical protein EVG20_g11027 [Dentipellis fragilis]
MRDAEPHTVTDEDTWYEEPHSTAAKVYSEASVDKDWVKFFDEQQKKGRAMGDWSPFQSEMDWRVAKWAIQEGIGHNAFNRFFSIEGTVERLVQVLLGNPPFADQVVYKPSKLFSDDSKKVCIYQEMWTGKWWNAVQEAIPQGHCVAPVIIASDKMQLTQFSGNKASYPVYLTLGNLPHSVRRKPSQHACILTGYLSAAKIKKAGLTAAEQKARAQALFHHSLRLILQPLMEPGKKGMKVCCGDGKIRKVHPVLAAYMADYPEQCLVAWPRRTQEVMLRIIKDLKSQTTSRSAFAKACLEQNLSGVEEPFWVGFPHTDIYRSLTPDILHQLYQGIFKHLLEWCSKMLSEEELDERLRRLPPSYGVRHFHNGFSVLSQVSGKERKQMAGVLLGCLVGAIPQSALVAVHSLLDFIYIAQYPTHDDTTLEYLETALEDFMKHRSIFVNQLKICSHFNIPKFHSLLHYVESIHFYGTTDNYNMEMFERFHIDFAKEAWQASNRHNEHPQMAQWLSSKKTSSSQFTHSLHPDSSRYSRSHPGAKKVYQLHLPPGLQSVCSAVEMQELSLPFNALDIWDSFKFKHAELGVEEALSIQKQDMEAVKSHPARGTEPARFDTVVVLYSDKAESTGVEGTRIGRLHAVFKLPRQIGNSTPAWADEHLAYMEWYTPFAKVANPQHMMYSVSIQAERQSNSSKTNLTVLPPYTSL